MKVCLANVPKRAGSCRTNSTPILNHPPHKGDPVKRAALYLRVSTLDQNLVACKRGTFRARC
jgi:hypothetical protein